MTLRKRINLLFIMILLACQCSLMDIKNTIYSDSEFLILEKTLNALEYGHGYDYELEMNYIYSYSYSKDSIDKKEKAFAEIINSSNFKTVLNLYEKILKLQAITNYKINKYKTESKWKYFTFIKNDLLDPLNNYSVLLSKYIIKKNPSLTQFFEMRKNSINIEIVKEYTKKDEIVDTF
ncbi:MAG: hypothetical protein V1874_05505 [Spirochaetota bacterium]